MNHLLSFFLVYLLGTIVMALIIRWGNAKHTSKSDCMSPKSCLLSWFGIGIFITFCLKESSNDGFIAKLLNYTNKK